MNSERPDRDRRINRQGLPERLARAEDAMSRTSGPTAEAKGEVLERRARELARVPPRPPDASEVVEVMTFTLGGERYAIDTPRVRGVVRLGFLTPIPGAPGELAGVMNVRGDILAVFDLRKIIGIGGEEDRGPSRVVVLGDDRDEFGVLADEIHEVTVLRIDRIFEPPGSTAGGGPRFLRGVTDDAVVVLDGSALLRDERFIIDQSEESAM